jgi:hypothetical protein
LFTILAFGDEPLLFLFLARLLRPQFAQRDHLGERFVLVDFGEPRLDLGKERANAGCVPSHVVIAVTRGCTDIDARTASGHRADADGDIVTKAENK